MFCGWLRGRRKAPGPHVVPCLVRIQGSCQEVDAEAQRDKGEKLQTTLEGKGAHATDYSFSKCPASSLEIKHIP